METMLASGGYASTVIPIEDMDDDIQALEGQISDKISNRLHSYLPN